MRIIAGKYKGLKLDSPKNFDIRPTSNRLKESLFSIIESKKNLATKSTSTDEETSVSSNSRGFV